MKYQKTQRDKNSTFITKKTVLLLEQDSANLLEFYSQKLNVCPEYIVEYLLDVLYSTSMPINNLDDIVKINKFIMAYDNNNSCSYKLVKVDDDEKLPRKERISKK